MQEVSYAHSVGALKAYLITASYVPTRTKARQSQPADDPARWFIESMTLSMVLIVHKSDSRLPRELRGSRVELSPPSSQDLFSQRSSQTRLVTVSLPKGAHGFYYFAVDRRFGSCLLIVKLFRFCQQGAFHILREMLNYTPVL